MKGKVSHILNHQIISNHIVVNIELAKAIKLWALKAAQNVFTIFSKIALYSLYKKPKFDSFIEER